MQGSLIKRGKEGIWYARIRIHGQQKTIRIGKMTKADAERALRQEIDRRERSLVGGDKKITFHDLADLWLENHKLDKKPKTIDSYGCMLRVHLLPYFEKMVVSAIRPEDVSKFVHQVAGKVSTTTTNYCLRLLRSILDYGIKQGHAFQNAATVVPRLKTPKKHQEPVSLAGMQAMLAAAGQIICSLPGQARLILMFAMMSGARLGEILAATWKNLDWETGVYTVKASYSPLGLDTPKTENSWRVIDLTPDLLRALKAHRARQAEQRLAMGGRYQDHGLIFATEVGTHINPSNVRNRILIPALEAAGLPHIRFHDLRSVYTTLMLESGAPVKYVQDQLGHSTPDMTLRVYAKVTREAKRTALNRFDQFISGSPEVCDQNEIKLG